MKQKHILYYYISLVLMVLVCSTAQAQNDSIPKTKNDSTVVKLKYGLRIGVDTGKLIRSFLYDEYTGIELVADYRLTKKLYLAGELGNEERIVITDFLNTTTKGSYFKAGIDYNTYQNWLDMDNMVYFGSRLAFSSFSHTINRYQVYSSDQYWAPQNIITESIEKEGLTAIWTELILGIKAELFNNLYFGLNVQLKVLLTETKPDNFQNIYIPGFNKTYDSTRIGVGYGYTLAYRIPLYKKTKVIAPVN
ncbi:DUF6048 family protein [Hyunsoonleella pacifica]|uniref:DUF481 domain-containing protein n=1 Tax=Hyunsoonleella pacifica TaxID=1080224 RepID=A0A4Q9FQQ0_9FLAO|nr:DUF6048 family protein [Hyunsoonleella pacifica]TBN17845.1 hypothetical protein EYD46_05905 [Hyunsoonleella pacifica]